MPAVKLTLEQEEELMRRARSGDGEAFGCIYDACHDFLYSAVIYPRVGDAETAEEILQDTFLLALKKIQSFEWRGKSVVAWLHKIAMNKVMEWSASRRKAPVYDDAIIGLVHDERFQPEAQVLLEDYQKRLGAKIGDILTEIPERYKQAIEMRLKEERSREACAEAMGITVGTYDVLFFRACRAFRKAYKEKYGKI